MLSFKEITTTEIVRNKHLPHVEDLMFLEGREGLLSSLRILGEVMRQSDEIAMSVKWDGKPAIVCGINPENGRFFVGTKAAFNKEVRAFHTVQEITKGIDNPELASKLAECFSYLPSLGIRGVLQGDLLFTSDSLMVTEEEVAFQPNAIRYSVNRGTPTSKALLAARLGVAFHTVYEGETMASLTLATYKFDPSSINADPTVWVPSISVNTLTESTPLDTATNEARVQYCKEHADRTGQFLTTLLTNRELIPFLSPYINATVMANISECSARGLGLYIESKVGKEILKLKTPKGREDKKALADRLINFTEVYAKQFDGAFLLHRKMALMKESLLQRVPLTEFRHHFVDAEGMRPTEPEGIVVSESKRAVKFVTRSRFSAQNRKVNG